MPDIDFKTNMDKIASERKAMASDKSQNNAIAQFNKTLKNLNPNSIKDTFSSILNPLVKAANDQNNLLKSINDTQKNIEKNQNKLLKSIDDSQKNIEKNESKLLNSITKSITNSLTDMRSTLNDDLKALAKQNDTADAKKEEKKAQKRYENELLSSLKKIADNTASSNTTNTTQTNQNQQETIANIPSGDNLQKTIQNKMKGGGLIGGLITGLISGNWIPFTTALTGTIAKLAPLMIAGGALIASQWDKISKWFKNMWGKYGEKIKNGAIVGLKALSKGYWKLITSEMAIVRNLTLKAGVSFVKGLTKIIPFIGEALTGLRNSLVEKLTQFGVSLGKKAVSALGKTTIGQTIKTTGKTAITNISTKVLGKEALKEGGEELVKGAVKTGAKTLGKGAIKGIAKTVLSSAGLGFLISIPFAINRFKKGDVEGGLLELASAIPFVGIPVSIYLMFRDMFGGNKSKTTGKVVTKSINKTSTDIKSMGKSIEGFFKKIGGLITIPFKWYGKMWSSSFSFIKKMFKGFGKTMSSGFGKIRTALATPFIWFADMWHGLTDWVGNLFSKIMNNGFVKRIAGFFGVNVADTADISAQAGAVAYTMPKPPTTPIGGEIGDVPEVGVNMGGIGYGGQSNKTSTGGTTNGYGGQSNKTSTGGSKPESITAKPTTSSNIPPEPKTTPKTEPESSAEKQGEGEGLKPSIFDKIYALSQSYGAGLAKFGHLARTLGRIAYGAIKGYGFTDKGASGSINRLELQKDEIQGSIKSEPTQLYGVTSSTVKYDDSLLKWNTKDWGIRRVKPNYDPTSFKETSVRNNIKSLPKSIGIAGSINYTGIDEDLLHNFIGMANDYYKTTGRTVQINSGWRSLGYQKHLYETLKPGRAAFPGRSMHNWGWAIDMPSREANKMLDQVSIEGGGPILRKWGFWQPIRSSEAWHLEAVPGQFNRNKMLDAASEYLKIRYGENIATNTTEGKKLVDERFAEKSKGKIKDLTTNNGVVNLPRGVRDKLTKLATGYFDKTGKPLKVFSGLRSTQEQKDLWDKYKNDKIKRQYLSRPGYSLHERGMAVDVDKEAISSFSDSQLTSFGFWRPAPEKEPWHIEPLSTKSMRAKNSFIRKVDTPPNTKITTPNWAVPSTNWKLGKDKNESIAVNWRGEGGITEAEIGYNFGDIAYARTEDVEIKATDVSNAITETENNRISNPSLSSVKIVNKISLTDDTIEKLSEAMSFTIDTNMSNVSNRNTIPVNIRR